MPWDSYNLHWEADLLKALADSDRPQEFKTSTLDAGLVETFEVHVVKGGPFEVHVVKGGNVTDSPRR